MKKLLVLFVLMLTLSFVGCSSEMTCYDGQYQPPLTTAQMIAASVENNEEYKIINENSFINTTDMPVSTFSADVDTAAYTIIRNKLNDNIMPARNSVRIEEMLNYFTYNLDGPEENEVIHVTKELSEAPWNHDHQLLMLGLKTEDIVFEETAGNNLVFLLDTSGSMNDQDKLPLLKAAILLLVDQLRPNDKISIVTYAGSSQLLLDGSDGTEKDDIIEAVNSLFASGSTAGADGIQTAYQVAESHFIEGGNNRIILATDGDFNVGISSEAGLERLIEEKRESGVFLSVCGFGTGNIKDNKMETLADKGNGTYYYIDNILEAKKVFVEELGGTLITVAKDVKLQVEFNPALVKGYRLIGYENRMLSYDDFDDDSVDAGDLGAGHEVIALYEIIPITSDEVIDTVTYEIPEDLKYNGENYLDEYLTLSIRYKDPESDQSVLREQVVYETDHTDTPSNNFKFASAVAEFGLLLLDSEYKYNSNYYNVILRATEASDDDYKDEFIDLVQTALDLQD